MAETSDPNAWTRRGVLAPLVAGPLLVSIATRLAAAPAPAGFGAFLESLWPNARAGDVRRETFDAAVAHLAFDPGLPRSSAGQPEFEAPIQTYVQQAVSAGRVAKGRTLAGRYAPLLNEVEARYGVPGGICLAAWGMESDFGRAQGTHDIVRTLASLAFTRPDRPVFRDEFVAALVILERGAVPRERLVGSWAGAMGDPQFLPSAYLKYAVSARGDASPDIWTNPADVVASIANFLRQQGWTPGQPWVVEVVLPESFAVPTLHAAVDDWIRLGLRRGDGEPLAGAGEAALFLPAGASGPAFLLFPNYFIIKQYNNSDSYALSLGALAGRIAGAPGLATPWPARPVVLSRADRIFVQDRLAALGLYAGTRDGKFGPKARDAIHAYQKTAGLGPADGFATPALVASLRRP